MKAYFVGTVSTAQLGNPTDNTWTPCAQVLLLGAVKGFDTWQYTGVVRNAEGSLDICLGLRVPYLDGKERAEGRGELYCTSALNFDQLDQYLHAAHALKIKELVAQYKDQIDQLEVAVKQS